jgi:hypothetical protein
MSGVDHGEIIHMAGRLGRSPALASGAPVLLAHGEPGQRCGWADFFSALRARGETAVPTPDGGYRIAPLAEAPSLPGHAGFLQRAAETLAALRGAAP